MQHKTDGCHEAARDTFDSMVSAYAGSIYNRLLADGNDRAVALRVLKETLMDIHSMMQTTGCPHPLEAMIYDRARHRQEELINQSVEQSISVALDNALFQDAPRNQQVLAITAGTEKPKEEITAAKSDHASEPSSDLRPSENNEQASDTLAESNAGQAMTEKKKHMGAGAVLLIVLLSIGIIAMLWVITGVAMNTGILPQADLGYQWFNLNIAPWF